MATRLMLIADVHGDDEALESALAWATKLGCAAVWCAGDLVEYGPNSTRTVRLAREHGVVCVRGNHDRWVTQQSGVCNVDGPMDDRGNVTSRTTERLPADDVAWLRALPLHVTARIEDVSLEMWHAQPKTSDMEFLFHDLPPWALRRASERSESDVIVIGHTHTPARIVCPKRRVILNPGTLLRQTLPGERELPTVCVHGVFATLDLPSRDFCVRSLRDGEPVGFVERTVY